VQPGGGVGRRRGQAGPQSLCCLCEKTGQVGRMAASAARRLALEFKALTSAVEAGHLPEVFDLQILGDDLHVW